MFVGNEELMFVDIGGKIFVQCLKELELEECKSIVVNNERYKLYILDYIYIYEYDIDIYSLQYY